MISGDHLDVPPAQRPVIRRLPRFWSAALGFSNNWHAPRTWDHRWRSPRQAAGNGRNKFGDMVKAVVDVEGIMAVDKARG
jgi:hypothetical protein